MPVVAKRSERGLLGSVVCWSLLAMLVFTCPALAAKKAPAPPPRLGVSLVVLFPDLAEDLGLGRERKGLVVTGVSQGSPAEAAGLKAGDVFVKLQKGKGKPVELANMTQWEAALKDVPADQALTVYVWRAGQEITVQTKRSTAAFGPHVQPPAGSESRLIDGGRGCQERVRGLAQGEAGRHAPAQGLPSGLDLWLNNLTVASLDPADPAVVQAVTVSGVSGVRLKGLSVSAPTANAAENGIILDQAAGATVEGCRIQGFVTGIWVFRSLGVVLEGNALTGNTGGIIVGGQSTAKVVRNFLRRNAVTRQGQGVAFSGGILVGYSQAEIVQNTVIENFVPHEQFAGLLYDSTRPAGIGIQLQQGTTAQVYNNLIASNNIGFLVDPNAQARSRCTSRVEARTSSARSTPTSSCRRRSAWHPTAGSTRSSSGSSRPRPTGAPTRSSPTP